MDKPAVTLAQAKAYFGSGMLAESEAAFLLLEKADGANAAVKAGLGMISLELGQLPGAHRRFRDALDLDPKNADALYGMGVIADQNSKRYFEEALRSNPNHRGALNRVRQNHAATHLAGGSKSRRIRDEADAPQPSQPLHSVPKFSNPTSVPAGDVDPPAVSENFGFYAALQGDSSSISKNAVALIDHLRVTTRPRMLDSPIALILLVVFLPACLFVTIPILAYGRAEGLSVVFGVLCVLLAIGPVIFLMQRRATLYELRDGLLKITRGILGKTTVTYELFRVTSVVVYRGPLQRMFGSGDLTLDVEGRSGAVKKVRLVGLARGRDLLGLQDNLRNLAQLLRQNPLIKGIIT